MKKLLLTVLVLFPLLTQAAAPLGSGWTSTTNPATARTALGAVSTNQFQTNLTAQAGTNTALQTQITARIPSSSGSGTNILLVAPTVKAAGGLILDVRDSANEQVATWENDGNISLSNLPSDPSHVITKGYADALAFGSGDSTNGVNTVLTNFISVQAQTNALKLTALRGLGTSNIFDVPTMTNPVVAVSVGISRLFFGDSFDIISDGDTWALNRLDGPNACISYTKSTDTFNVQENVSIGESLYVSAGQDPLAVHVEGGTSWFSNNVVNLGRAGFYSTFNTNGDLTSPSGTFTNLSTNSPVWTSANGKNLISGTNYSLIATNIAGNTNTLALSTNGTVITLTHTWTNSAGGSGSQTPWETDIDGNYKTLFDAKEINIGSGVEAVPLRATLGSSGTNGFLSLYDNWYIDGSDTNYSRLSITYAGNGQYRMGNDTLIGGGSSVAKGMDYDFNYHSFIISGVSAWLIDGDKNWIPGQDGLSDIGTPSNRVDTIYVNSVDVEEMNLTGTGAGQIYLRDDDHSAGVSLAAPAVVDSSYRNLLPTNAGTGFVYGEQDGTNVNWSFRTGGGSSNLVDSGTNGLFAGQVFGFSGTSATNLATVGQLDDLKKANVSYWGAVGDGTTDDYEALTNAVAGIGEGGTLEFETNKTYKISRQIVPLAGQQWKGNGATLKRAAATVVTTATQIDPTAGIKTVVLSDATEFPVGTRVAVYTNDTYFDHSTHLVITRTNNTIQIANDFTTGFTNNIKVVNAAGPLIYVNVDDFDLTGLKIDDNRSQNTNVVAWELYSAIYIEGSTENVIVSKCKIEEIVCEGIIMGGFQNIVRYNFISNAGGNGIHVGSLRGGKILNNYIGHCQLDGLGPGHEGGAISYSQFITNLLVAGNYFDDCWAPVNLSSTSNEGLIFCDNTVTNMSLSALFVGTGSYDARIIGNRFSGSAPMSLSGSNITVLGNGFRDAKLAASTMVNGIVSGNHFWSQDTNTPSMTFTSCANISITGNLVSDGSTNSIVLLFADNADVFGNNTFGSVLNTSATNFNSFNVTGDAFFNGNITSTNSTNLGTSYVTGGATVMGSLGIGTNAPGYPLDVFSSSGGRLSGLGLGQGMHWLISPANGTQSYGWVAGISGVSATSFALRDDTAAVNRIVITSSGNVGIGTNAPTGKFQVLGIPVYADNAAAVTGGLGLGAFYRTGADPDPVCVVH